MKTLWTLLAVAVAVDFLVWMAVGKVGHEVPNRPSAKPQLFQIIEYGNSESLRSALASGHISREDFAGTDPAYGSPILFAADRDKSELIPTLVELGAKADDRKALLRTVEAGRFEVVRYLLANGAVAKGRRDQEGRTLLFHAITYHAADPVLPRRMLNLLMENGVDPNIADDNGDTPLHFAARYGPPDAGKVLREGGANPRVKNARGQTPLESIGDMGGLLHRYGGRHAR